jgi:hypothetical protein
MSLSRAPIHLVYAAVAVALLVAPTPAARAATLQVANNGADAEGCGTAQSPCRSISRAIADAAPGDTIVVGPGVYGGDLDADMTVGEPGEETGSPGCGCMLSVNKPVSVISRDGAGSTVIDARAQDVATNVLLILDGGEFGRPGKGFTVTNTGAFGGDGIVIDSANVQVRGNQVVAIASNAFPGTSSGSPGDGIRALAGGPVLVEGNQVMGWTTGIGADGTGKTVRRNKVSLNYVGIAAPHTPFATSTAAVVGNVVSGNVSYGIALEDGTRAFGNGAYGNSTGISCYGSAFSGVIEKNNLFGNRSTCGLANNAVPDLPVARNYWGAASGPGPDPADEVCNLGAGTTAVAPFAKSPFRIKAPLKP